MKILVTGASGFLGRELVRQRLLAGDEVITVGRTPTDIEIEGNIAKSVYLPNWPTSTDDDSWIRVLKGLGRIDCVFHLAGDAHYGNKGDYTNSNVVLTRVLLQTIATLKPTPKFVFSSSIGAMDYSRTEKPRLRNEIDIPFPKSKYGKSKLEAEKFILDAGIEYSIARLGMIIGRDMRQNSHVKVLSRLTQNKILREILLHLNGSMPLVTVEDAARALSILGENSESSTYLVVGSNIKLSNVVSALFGKFNTDKWKINLGYLGNFVPSPLDAVVSPVLQFDSSKLKSLGWQPELDIEKYIYENLGN